MRHVALWAALIAPPVIWLSLLETNYVLAYAACGGRGKWFLFATVAVSIALAGAAGFAGWRMGPPNDSDERSAPWTPHTREIRARWMSIAGIAMAAWFVVVLLAMAVPPMVLGPCD